MDGIHDMGGMRGFGAVDTDDDDPFHHEWEEQFHALTKVLGVHDLYNADQNRQTRERLRPAYYLAAGYYEQRLLPLQRILVERGVLDEGEVDERIDELDGTLPERTDPQLTEQVREALSSNSSFEREPKPPAFEPGDDVVVRNMHPDGHTRCPRYVQQTRGVVSDFHGTQRFPDESARGNDVGEPLYSVRFTARDVWGDDHPESDTLVLQLWEPYLREP